MSERDALATVPLPATAFIGRTVELAALAARFAAGARLVTVVGPAGVGKTRLACEHASRAGVAALFADASDARDADAFRRAMATALGADVSSEPAIARVLAYRGPLLVVVDNVEQVIEAAAPLLADWTRDVATVQFLVTSREALRVAREVVVELEPLATTASPGAPLSDAVALLMDRAASVLPTVRARSDLASVAGAIAQRLDGLPLAIELAAARLGVLGPQDLLARLDHSLDLLARGPRGERTERRQTLRHAIAWSWSLLTADEQSVLAQCAVFRGGFTVPAAEAVVIASGAPMLDVLHALQDKSLLRATQGEGERRLALYAAVREFATEQLAHSDPDAVRTRHAAYYAQLAVQYGREAYGRDGIRARARLARETENIRAVLAWAEAPGAPAERVALALETASAFEPAVYASGGLDALIAQVSALLQAGEALGVPARTRAAARIARGTMRSTAGQGAEAWNDFDAGRQLAREAGDRAGEARALVRGAIRPMRTGRPDEGLAMLREAVRIFREIGDAYGEAHALLHLGAPLSERGRSAEARDVLGEALAVAERIGSAWYIGQTLFYQVLVFVDFGYFADAEAALERVSKIFSGADEPLLNVDLLYGMFDHVCGRLDAARARLESALSNARRCGQRSWEGMSLLYLGMVLVDAGARDEAESRLIDARAVLREVGELRYEALARAWQGALEAQADRIEQSAASFAAAASVLPPTDALRPALTALETALDLARARAARDPSVARVHRRAADERLYVDTPPMLQIEAREARHAAERWLGTVPDVPRRAVSIAPPAAAQATLVVHSKGHWVQFGTGRRIDFHQRQAIRRLVVCLAEARRATPGTPVPVDTLIEAGWPGVNVRWDTARRRLGVSLTRMRSAGLRDVLKGDDDGYWFDANVDVSIVDHDDPTAD